eukprot:PhM_4_TR11165/c0_g1_i1/m.3026
MAYVDYTPGERPSEAAILSGRMPRQLHFFLHPHPMNSLKPATLEHTAQWLQTSFKQKEDALHDFYHKDPHAFAPPLSHCATPVGKYLVSALFWAVAVAFNSVLWMFVAPWWAGVAWVLVVVGVYVKSK